MSSEIANSFSSREMAVPSAPLWATLGEEGRIAGLDVHSVSCINIGDGKPGDIRSLNALVDQASEAGVSLLALNPVNDTGEKRACPYCAIGLSSYNPAHVALEGIPGFDPKDKAYEALLNIRDRLRKTEEDPALFNHANLREFKLLALRLSWIKVQDANEEGAEKEAKESFETWRDNECLQGVKDYAIFSVLKQRFGAEKSWWEWGDEYKFKAPNEIYEGLSDDDKEEVQFILYTQWVAEKQWGEAQGYAASKGVHIAMDKPIYPQSDSADVWAHPELFYLYGDEDSEKKGQPRLVSGVNSGDDKDPFGKQKWGHAVYRFQEKPEEVIDFFVEVVRQMAKVSNVIRLDHALALIWKYYLIPTKYDAVFGHYFNALKDRLLGRLKKEFPDVYFYAEDIGRIDEDGVTRPLLDLGMLGLRSPILSDKASEPRYGDVNAYPVESVAMTDNHDSVTPQQWWAGLPEDKKRFVLGQMYGEEGVEARLNEPLVLMDYIRWILRSKAGIAMATLRTFEGDNRRYNVPGVDGPLFWQIFSQMKLEDMKWGELKQIILETGRKALDAVGLSPNRVLATNPGKGEVPKIDVGGNFNFSIATSTRVKQIKVWINALVGGTPVGEAGWQEKVFTTEIAAAATETGLATDNVCISTVQLDLAVVSVGDYEFSGQVEFEDGTTVNLTEIDKNFKFQVVKREPVEVEKK